MPKRGAGGYYRRAYRGRTRSLEWDALEANAVTNVPAAQLETVILAFNTNTSPETKTTIYRIVGNFGFRIGV